MKQEFYKGKKIRVRFTNSSKDLFFTVKEVIDLNSSVLLFKDREDVSRGIRIADIQEVYDARQ